jgi:glycine C-acetyltransferase
MPDDRLAPILADHVQKLAAAGTAKRHERVISGVVPGSGGRGPRVLIEGHGGREFLAMNANSYLGLGHDEEMIAAGESAVRAFATGPGAVRFIAGTWAPHAALEARLARFHAREAAMVFSSAYAAMMGTLPQLVTAETAVISDELNHNCIINAVRLGAPKEKRIYPHLDMAALERHLDEAGRTCRRAIVVTDGVFSMRGDFAPLDRIGALVGRYDPAFAENALLVVDDSHGVGAFGGTGRGSEEVTASPPADLLVATLGKALGVNGGYVAAAGAIIDFLRETSPFYIYSNPITPGEAAAALTAVDILDRPRGRELLAHLAAMSARFERGLEGLGLEIIAGPHPITPLMVRDTARAMALVGRLFERGILATAIVYPVVPRGAEEIRFQISAAHTPGDIDEAIAAIGAAAAGV